MLKIAIVGLSNVGKSTLFNRLVGRKAAIVSNISGVTRDRHEETGKISDLKFKVIDTGGWDNQSHLSSQIIEQIESSLSDSNIIFFLVDAKVQNEQNKKFAKWLKRKTNNPILLIANKCESYKSKNIDYLQFFDFIGPIYISAEHNLGMIDLYDALSDTIKNLNLDTELLINKSSKLRIAIIGRPNVGKSTFLNTLLAKKRLITNPEPGTTRNSIDIKYNYNGELITFIDTAGIYKKENIIDNLESKFIKKSIESIKRSHVAILMLDSIIDMEQQNLSLGKIAIKEGKGIIIVLNKWDLINKNKKNKLIKLIEQQERTQLLLDVPIITISALKSIHCNKVLNKCLEVNQFLNKKISTSKLNKWLINALNNHSHPLVKGRIIKIKYIAQTGTNPPAFSLICNIPESVDK
ncbi:MAG: ribosome biogenesis GTPase Der, partial [Wolbachia pipientis]|nr:ribosome biogenesis GTPase Der [Wolbachia pipientis]